MDLIELGKTPISKSQPAGTDVRFEPSFEQLEIELAKLNSPLADGTVLWDQVVILTSDILADQSKDLLVACYLAYGLMKQDGLEGLAVGFHILKDMLDTFWDTMYPPVKRIRGRINALAWLVEKVDESMNELTPVAWQQEQREGYFRDINELDELIRKYMEDGPLLISLEIRFADLISEKPAAEPETEEQRTENKVVEENNKPSRVSPEHKPSEPEVTGSADPIPAQDSTTDNPERLIKQGLDLLGRAATGLLKQESLTSLPFILNRIAAWLPVRQAPPATDGKTLLPPPDEQVRSLLESMYQNNNWHDLLVAAESRVRQYLFWMDLHRYVAVSLEELNYSGIARTIASETEAFLNRVPGIEKLAFSDGFPFTSHETRDWIQAISSSTDQRQLAMPTASTGDSGAHIAEELNAAQALLADKQVKQALSAFREHINRAESQKEHYLWEVAFCMLILRAKQPRIALPYAHRILEAITRFELEVWDPALALDGLDAALATFTKQEDTIIDTALIGTVLNRISAIDPARAIDYM